MSARNAEPYIFYQCFLKPEEGKLQGTPYMGGRGPVFVDHMCYSLNSLNGGYLGDYIGEY